MHLEFILIIKSFIQGRVGAALRVLPCSTLESQAFCLMVPESGTMMSSLHLLLPLQDSPHHNLPLLKLQNQSQQNQSQQNQPQHNQSRQNQVITKPKSPHLRTLKQHIPRQLPIIILKLISKVGMLLTCLVMFHLKVIKKEKWM